MEVKLEMGTVRVGDFFTNQFFAWYSSDAITIDCEGCWNVERGSNKALYCEISI